jgi:putative ABC transport system ATP-binding protein
MIRLLGLQHRYGKESKPLRFADFSWDGESEALLLQGPSGSGKSTLLALMCGLLRVQQGEVWLGEAGLHAMSAAQADAWRGGALGLVPQRLFLSPVLSVAENLALPYVAAALPPDNQRIDSLLVQLGLQGLGQRRPGQLSLGQAQRVALARGLLRRPQWLLADEPTANLDDANAAQVLRLLCEAAQQQSARLVIATHDRRVGEALPRAVAWHLGAAQRASS